jgi:hypothetical protein
LIRQRCKCTLWIRRRSGDNDAHCAAYDDAQGSDYGVERLIFSEGCGRIEAMVQVRLGTVRCIVVLVARHTGATVEGLLQEINKTEIKIYLPRAIEVSGHVGQNCVMKIHQANISYPAIG